LLLFFILFYFKTLRFQR